ncbi:hypothetical protein [Amycolatopsis sp. NPDC004079]|uniref:hypothetical protein n=1 Tax=Amycolatopsis sp. NPDC004079 TaxID=3154549 RepID=UPI0033A30789
MASQLPQCTRCNLTLRRKNDPVFKNTVLAKGSHRCEPAMKILNQATSAAELFATEREFVHVRYISPIITPQSWMTVLQEWTVTHDLVHRTLPMPQGAAFVVSHRQDFEPDMQAVVAKMHDAIAAAGDGPAPERIIASWEGDTARIVMTHSRDRAMP